MKEADFLVHLNELLELPARSLNQNDVLAEFERWDSLATVGFIALADRHLGVAVDPGEVTKAETVGDLLKLVAEQLK